MGLNLKDVIEVTKAGYAPAEVKELFALAKDNDEVVSLAKEGYKPNDIREFIELAKASDVEDAPAEPKEPAEPTEPAEPSEPKEPDEKDARIKELETLIANMQTKNVNQSVSPQTQTDEDILDNALQGLLN